MSHSVLLVLVPLLLLIIQVLVIVRPPTDEDDVAITVWDWIILALAAFGWLGGLVPFKSPAIAEVLLILSGIASVVGILIHRRRLSGWWKEDVRPRLDSLWTELTDAFPVLKMLPDTWQKLGNWAPLMTCGLGAITGIFLLTFPWYTIIVICFVISIMIGGLVWKKATRRVWICIVVATVLALVLAARFHFLLLWAAFVCCLTVGIVPLLLWGLGASGQRQKNNTNSDSSTQTVARTLDLDSLREKQNIRLVVAIGAILWLLIVSAMFGFGSGSWLIAFAILLTFAPVVLLIIFPAHAQRYASEYISLCCPETTKNPLDKEAQSADKGSGPEHAADVEQQQEGQT
jgi:hypothetical protein